MLVNPDTVAAAVPDLANIGATISDANAAAAALTTGLVPAAEDEISAAIGGLFRTYAQDYHALVTQAAALHTRFAQAVGASAESYVAAEAANAGALLRTAQQDLVGMVNAPAKAAAQVVVIQSAGLIPENGYPFGGLKQLTNEASIALGVQELDLAIQQALPQALAQGNTLQIFGYSQSAVIASLEMANLQAEGVPTGPNSPVSFLIVGDPMNPNGGFYERFAGLELPSLGFKFYGATPSNAYPTTIITIEYDSYADFPQYPLDILSDLNALESTNHFYYHVLTTQQLDNAIILPTSGPTTTTYKMIPATQLPLLSPIRPVPIIGNPIADLLQPDLTYLVNLGYGDPRYGWSTGPANVPTQAGLLPPLSSFEMLPGLLSSGAQQGFHDFMGDFTGSGPNPVTLSFSSVTNPLTSLYSSAAATTGPLSPITSVVTNVSTLLTDPVALQSALVHLPNAIAQVISVPYTAALASLDIVNAAVIGIPSYDVNLFLDGIQQALNGQPLMGLVNAVGQPIASDVALYLWLGSLESTIINSPVEAAGPATGLPALGIVGG
jgi:PE-PPE domain-containing protein/PE family protein